MTTKAAILVRLRQPLVLADVEIPVVGRGQVLVKMLAAGLCRSQLSEIAGHRGKDNYLPHLLGHEGSATIEQTGLGVKTVKLGDYVVVSWIKGAGLSAPGGQYKWGKKTVNSGGAAVFTERAVVSEDRVTKISKIVPPDVAAVIGCAVATGAGAVRHTMKAKRGSSLVIWGVGGVGASAVMAGAAAGCGEIIAVDVSKRKLDWAASIGATATINAKRVDPVAAIMRRLPEGADYALEATGVAGVGEQALAALNKTGLLVLAGHPKLGSKICIDPFMLIEGRRVAGTWGGETVPERDFAYYGRAWRAGSLPLRKLITDRYALGDINQALGQLEKGNAGRIIIEF